VSSKRREWLVFWFGVAGIIVFWVAILWLATQIATVA
jgi:hypothetical protein